MNKIIWTVLAAVFDITLSAGKTGYPRWAKPMKQLGYGWKAVPVTTKDNYELTFFNVKG